MLLARVPEGLAPQHDGDCFVECIVAQPNLGRRAGVGFDGVQEEEAAQEFVGCHHWSVSSPRHHPCVGSIIDQYDVDQHTTLCWLVFVSIDYLEKRLRGHSLGELCGG